MLKKWNQSFYFGIWDTAGQERFTRISSYYCRGAQAAILAFDLTDRDSFISLENYARFLADAEKDCLVIIIGTKGDLVEEQPERRQVTKEEGQRYAAELRAQYYETSAKTNVNVTPVFDRIGYHFFSDRLSNGAEQTVKKIEPNRPSQEATANQCVCSIQ